MRPVHRPELNLIIGHLIDSGNLSLTQEEIACATLIFKRLDFYLDLSVLFLVGTLIFGGLGDGSGDAGMLEEVHFVSNHFLKHHLLVLGCVAVANSVLIVILHAVNFLPLLVKSDEHAKVRHRHIISDILISNHYFFHSELLPLSLFLRPCFLLLLFAFD